MTQTPRYGHAPIKMEQLEQGSEFTKPGQYYWNTNGGKKTLVLAIPRSADLKHTYSRWSIDWKNHCNASWSLTGTDDCPTLSPSLHAVGVWHGFVRNGMLVEA